LNTIAGQLQVEKYFKGSSGRIELYPAYKSNFLIWIAPKEVQKKIEEMILSTFELENQFNHVLEVAIEKDENVAQKWGTEQTKDV
jgi:type I restriction enzyme M protein